jgi:hypothetical protein
MEKALGSKVSLRRAGEEDGMCDAVPVGHVHIHDEAVSEQKPPIWSVCVCVCVCMYVCDEAVSEL